MLEGSSRPEVFVKLLFVLDKDDLSSNEQILFALCLNNCFAATGWRVCVGAGLGDSELLS